MTIHTRFETIVSRFPDHVAVKSDGFCYSYSTIYRRANSVAAHLTEKGIVKGDIVAVTLNHSVDLVVALLAILKCGAAYLPLNYDSPVKYLESCLEAASVNFLICYEVGKLEGLPGVNIISIKNNAIFSAERTRFLDVKTDDEAIAYVMFTSGSTGKPKATIIPHRAVLRLVLDTNYITITHSDSILQFAPPSFDASTFEVWGALLNGATLVLYSGVGLDPNTLKRDIFENNVTILWLTAALFHLVANSFIELFSSLRVLLSGGDVINPKYVKKLFDHYPGVIFINGYGPTENTTFTCCHVIKEFDENNISIPIGNAISGTCIHILDDKMNSVDDGSIGTLYVSGSGVALGYLNQSNSGNTFFYNKNIADGLIYNTGDLVKKNDLGQILFIGRVDNQVKVRGYRVSIEEIKLHIVELDGISDAVVTVQENDSGDQVLVAYIKCENLHVFNGIDIKRLLSESLPEYMIPDKINFSNELPINANGKFDKKKLLLKDDVT